MINLKKPDLIVEEVYKSCISTINNESDKVLHEGIIDIIDNDEKIYDDLAQNHALFRMSRKENGVNKINKEQMLRLYKYRFVQKRAYSDFYGTILASSDICPYCEYDKVKQVDHYLPEASFNSLVVTPINLVPSCKECNDYKGQYIPSSINEELWHPYYDLYNIKWLKAEVTSGTPFPTVNYYVEGASLDEVMTARIKKTFDVLHLNDKYKYAAMREIMMRKNELSELKGSRGTKCVQLALESIRKSIGRAFSNNYCLIALYDNLVVNNWYINDYL